MIPEESLQILLDRLDELGIPFMVAGSFASNAHGVPRVTQDADVIIETDLDRLLQLMDKLGHEFYADPDSAREAFTGSRMLNIIHLETGFKIDIILRKPRAFSLEEFRRRCKINFLGKDRWFATPEDTILTKLEWSKLGQSERQYEDALNIARVQGESLDLAYLARWSSELGLEDLLNRLLVDAGLKS
ncbi:MAG: hypothetical protein JRJ03_10345 [Deltaproteobacteria bacterium]|nr:hypothetical protein [Deltaproteobacteria bacterium]